MKKTILLLFTSFLIFTACENRFKVTFDPKKDANTYIEHIKSGNNFETDTYLTMVIREYINTDRKKDLDQFTEVLVREMGNDVNTKIQTLINEKHN